MSSTSDLKPSIESLLVRGRNAGLFCGAIAGWIQSGGSLHTVSVGKTSLVPPGSAITEETWFDLASLTKPLVGTTLTLLALRDGGVALTDRVDQHLGETANTAIGEARVLDLLTHTSGLPAWRPLYCLSRGLLENAVDALAGIDLEYRPGEKVVYSCLGFLVLREILDQVFDRSVENTFADEVLVPLKLERRLGFLPDLKIHTLAAGALSPKAEAEYARELGFDAELIPNTAPHLPDDGNTRFLRGVSLNAGLFGSIAGVTTLANHYLASEASLLSRQEIRQATMNRTAEQHLHRALGWQMATSEGCSAGSVLSPEAFGHTGFTGTSLWVDPTRELIVALLANRHHPGHRDSDLHPIRRRLHSLIVNSVG